MNCTRCGGPDGFEGKPGYGLCDRCFRGAVDGLTAAIENAPGAGAATVIYLEGMAELGADRREVLADIAGADLEACNG